MAPGFTSPDPLFNQQMNQILHQTPAESGAVLRSIANTPRFFKDSIEWIAGTVWATFSKDARQHLDMSVYKDLQAMPWYMAALKAGSHVLAVLPIAGALGRGGGEAAVLARQAAISGAAEEAVFRGAKAAEVAAPARSGINWVGADANVAERELQRSVARLRGLKVKGDAAVTDIRAFGSRAGSTYTRSTGPTALSDLDVFIETHPDLAGAQLARVETIFNQIAADFTAKTGIQMNISAAYKLTRATVAMLLGSGPTIPF